MNFMTSLLVILLATVGICLPSSRARRRALVGPLILSLAAASLRLTRGAAGAVGDLPVTYSAVTAALLVIALALPAGLALLALRDPTWERRSRLVALAAALGALGLGLRTALPLAMSGGLTTLTATGVLIGIAGLLRYAGPRLAAALRWVDAFAFPVPPVASHRWDQGARRLLAVTVACAALACASPRLEFLLLAVGTGAVTGLLLERRIAGGTRWPVATPLALAFLAIAAYLMLHVAGDTPLTLRELVDAPYSPAFETLGVLLLGLVSWVLLGLFPFASAQRGALSPLLAGALLARVAGPVLPDGWVHWQPVFYLVATVAAWHAAATRRDEETLVALASLGLLSESATAAWCGIAFVAGAVLFRAVEWVAAAGGRLNLRGELLLRFALVVAAPLLVPLLFGALQAQTFYTVATVLGVAGSLFGTRLAAPR